MSSQFRGMFIVGLVAWGSSVGPASAQQPDPGGCAKCHGLTPAPGATGTPFETLPRSAHSTLACTDCHQSISITQAAQDAVRPHGDSVTRVNCGECHEEEARVYAKHGRLEVDEDQDLPRCWSCHGTHDILPSTSRHSRVHPTNLPGTCRSCHTDIDLVKKHFILRAEPIKLHEKSVHGRATKKGLYLAAACDDCHSAADANGRRTAHRILSPDNPESTIHRLNIPDTCGKCHKYVIQDYWEGIHGQYVKRGAVDAPVCTNCHGEHGIISPSDKLSPVSSTRLAEETCAPCHESAVLNEKYGLPGDRLTSYIDSYHGLKSKAGDVTVANCASCHGSHRILPSGDPTSSIHADNLQATCGACHPKISVQLAQTRIHETATGLRTGWPEFFRKLYIVVIVATIGLMVLHNAADWMRHFKRMITATFVQRFSVGEAAQHWVLMLSFSVLVITGFSLRFSDAAWVKLLFGWEGGFKARGLIHRIAAVIMALGTAWHILYLFTPRGRNWFRDMVARRTDWIHVRQNAAYFLGLREQPPRFGRFSYMEKVEYWAVMWGTVIMMVTGLLLWFENYFIDRWGLTKSVLDVVLVIHYYEAWLAFLAILVWHVYGTVFKPGVYPMNPAWLSGRMPREMYSEEHPEGPKLEARAVRIRNENEEEETTDAKADALLTEEAIGGPMGSSDSPAVDQAPCPQPPETENPAN